MDFTAAQIDNESLGTAVARSRALLFASDAARDGEAAAAAPVSRLLSAALPGTTERVALLPVTEMTEDLPPDQLAFLALNGLVSAALSGTPLSACMVRIGSAVAVERWVALTRRSDPDKVKKLLRNGRLLRGVPEDARRLARFMAKHGSDPAGLDNQALFDVAAPLVGAAWDSGLFERASERDEDGFCLVFLTEDAAQQLAALDESLPWQRPRLLPMVVQPGGWEEPDRAPYLTPQHRLYLHVLGRAKGRSRTVLKQHWKRDSLRPFRTAVDTLGEVPFRVDAETIDAIRFCWDSRLVVGDVPSRDRLEYVEPEGLAGMGEDRRKEEWKIRKEYRDLNLLNRTLGAELLKDLDAARMMSCYPAIWHPHYADFRGRLYTASSLSHHRSDYLRAAFRFARPVELGEDGGKWLARHVANAATGKRYGKLDKEPWAVREAFARDDTGLLTEIATNWRERPELWSQGVDHPFQFLQACQEWRRYLLHDGQPEGFRSDIIVGLDATCSGSQHYAAVLRAEEEGTLVNLLPADRPADVYAVVADRVRGLLRSLAGSAEDSESLVANQWLDYGVERGTIKRQVMTFLYGSEVYGFKRQLKKDLMDPLKRKVLLGQLGKHPFDGDDGSFKACLLMARVIWQAVQSVFPRTVSGMAWLHDAGSLCAKHGLGVEWTTPSGFPAVQRYERGDTKEVRFTLGRASARLNLATDERKKLVSHKQRNGLPPNFIHSLDASHLHLTVCAMAERGVRDMAMIHDSFGTHAGNTELMARTLRETFVQMYTENDPLDAVYRWALQALPGKSGEKLAPPPTKGGLDISGVLSSPYFFC